MRYTSPLDEAIDIAYHLFLPATTLVIIAANFAADMVYVRLDPRARH